MKLRKPDYYDRFRCIAGACKDSCCIGWEIDIDEKKQEEYEKVPGTLGDRLKKYIDRENGCFILQGEEERCPFLNEENLCDLILGLGEEALCDICREHPRFYDWFDGLTEAGLGLCCEAAAKLILDREEPDRFFLEDISECEEGAGEADEDPEHWTDALFEAREAVFFILQDRSCSLRDRCSRILWLADELQDGIDFDGPEAVRETAKRAPNSVTADISVPVPDENMYGRLVSVCRRLEPIDREWTRMLDRLEAFSDDPLLLKKTEEALDASLSGQNHEYEHLLVYFTYRHFMKCRYDGDLKGRVMLSVFCTLMIRLLDLETFMRTGILSVENRIQNAGICSREIEYSEENTEFLRRLFRQPL